MVSAVVDGIHDITFCDVGCKHIFNLIEGDSPFFLVSSSLFFFKDRFIYNFLAIQSIELKYFLMGFAKSELQLFQFYVRCAVLNEFAHTQYTKNLAGRWYGNCADDVDLFVNIGFVRLSLCNDCHAMADWYTIKSNSIANRE